MGRETLKTCFQQGRSSLLYSVCTFASLPGGLKLVSLSCLHIEAFCAWCHLSPSLQSSTESFTPFGSFGYPPPSSAAAHITSSFFQGANSLLSPLMSFCSVLCTSLFFLVCQEDSFNLLSALGRLPEDSAYHFSQPGDEMEIPSVSQQGEFETFTSLSWWYHRTLKVGNDPKREQMCQLQGRRLAQHSSVCVFLSMILPLHNKHSIKAHFPASYTVTVD